MNAQRCDRWRIRLGNTTRFVERTGKEIDFEDIKLNLESFFNIHLSA
jgi:hypothetical protein